MIWTCSISNRKLGWSAGAIVLGKLPVPWRPIIWMIVDQRLIALAVGAGEGCLDIFTLIYLFSPLFHSLCKTTRYGLKYCLKGPLKQKQPTNQIQTFKVKVTLTLRNGYKSGPGSNIKVLI